MRYLRKGGNEQFCIDEETEVHQAIRLQKTSANAYQELAQLREEATLKGSEIIDLSIGSPDKPPPPYILERLIHEISKDSNHGYPPMDGVYELRKAVANWYRRRFGVRLDPEREVYPTIGTKEAISNLFRAVLNKGDGALIPNPGYPPYSAGTYLAEGIPHFYALVPENQFNPVFKALAPSLFDKVKILILTYPNNPTGAIASEETFSQAVEMGVRYNILVCHDNPYVDITFDGNKGRSLLEFEGAKEVGIEFFSFSKLFNMAGWRLACAVGNAKAISVLRFLKRKIDSGIFIPVQYAGATALGEYDKYENHMEQTRLIYERRRDIAIEVLKHMGWDPFVPKGAMYVWTKLPNSRDSLSFTKEVFTKTGVLVAPGIMYGDRGEGYIRISLVREADVLKEALERIGRAC